MLRNLSSLPFARKLFWAPASLSYGRHCRHSQLVTLRSTLCAPIFLPFSPRISRYSTVPSAPGAVKHKPNLRLRIVEKAKEEYHRFVNGSKQLGRNTKMATFLLGRVVSGHTLNRRERILMIQTVSDLVRMVPLIIILVVPFAEFALPVLLKLFPNMLPSTFVSASHKEVTQARNLQAKLEVIEVLQAATEDIVLRGKLDSKDLRESLVSFMTKVSRGEEVDPQEVLKVSKAFHNEFSLGSLERSQLLSLVKFFGLPSIGTTFILQEELKFKWNLVKKDDAHILRDGIDNLSPAELEEAAIFRGFSSSNAHHNKKQYLQEWISLSQENVPPYLLLLSRSHYFVRATKQATDITPPIIAPHLSLSADQTLPATIPPKQPSFSETPVIDLPEKEILPIEFKNLHHELSYDPVAAKLWTQIARFTRDLKKESFGGRQMEVIYLGDSTPGDNVSTAITREMRQYLQAIFIALDKDCDRKLSVDEVRHGLCASDIPVQHEAVVTLVRMHDKDGDDCLSFDEFVDCLLYVRKRGDIV